MLVGRRTLFLEETDLQCFIKNNARETSPPLSFFSPASSSERRQLMLGMYQIRIRFEDPVSNLFGFGFDRTSVPIDSDSTETRFLEIRIRPRFVILKCGKIRQNNDVCTSADAFFKLTPSCLCIYIREKIEMNLLERVRKNRDHQKPIEISYGTHKQKE